MIRESDRQQILEFKSICEHIKVVWTYKTCTGQETFQNAPEKLKCLMNPRRYQIAADGHIFLPDIKRKTSEKGETHKELLYL